MSLIAEILRRATSRPTPSTRFPAAVRGKSPRARLHSDAMSMLA
jgi:hypothetical protein